VAAMPHLIAIRLPSSPLTLDHSEVQLLDEPV
jgi:hypothetical protein